MSVDKRYLCDTCGDAGFGRHKEMFGFLHGPSDGIKFVDKTQSERHMCVNCLRGFEVAIALWIESRAAKTKEQGD